MRSAYALAMQGPEWMEPKLPEVTTPFLIIHGEADVVTDPAVSKRLFEVAATEDKTLKLIPGAKHADCFWREESYEMVRQWLATRTQRS